MGKQLAVVWRCVCGGKRRATAAATAASGALGAGVQGGPA